MAPPTGYYGTNEGGGQLPGDSTTDGRSSSPMEVESLSVTKTRSARTIRDSTAGPMSIPGARSCRKLDRLPEASYREASYLPHDTIGDEYVPDYSPPTTKSPTAFCYPHRHSPTAAAGGGSTSRKVPLQPLTTSHVGGINSGEYLPVEEEDDSSEGPTKSITETFKLDAAAHILASPTLGLSETEWKAIPFSTRRKLKSSMEQVGSALFTSDVNTSQISSLSSSASSIAPMVAKQLDGAPLSFSSRRKRERAMTMYPEIDNSPARSPFEYLRKSNSNLSRSVSVSTSPSAGYSPAYQYLSRYGSASGQGAGTDGYLGEQIGNYVIGKLIGYGAFSQIREAVTFENDVKVLRAVKIVKKVNTSQSTEKMEQVQAEFDHEVTLWKLLDHPNILKLITVEEDDTAIYCFAEKISNGTLLDSVRRLKQKLASSDEQVVRTNAQNMIPTTLDYLRQITSALSYLHNTMHIVHRDFKLENCLMEKQADGSTKIILCDFGMSAFYETGEDGPPTSSDSNTYLTAKPSLSTCNSSASISSSRSDGSSNHLLIGPSDTSSRIHQMEEDSSDVSRPPSSVSLSISATTNNGGSLPYACPQLLQSNISIVNPYTDMWALGVVMYALLMGRLPWQHGFAPKLRMMIIEAKWDDQAVEKLYNKPLVDILRSCLRVDPMDRATVSQVKEALQKLS